MNLVTKIKEELNGRDADPALSAFCDAGFIFPFEKSKIDPTKLSGGELTAFISGVFLSCGGGQIEMGENHKAGYDIEFSFENIVNSRIFCELLSQFEILPKLTLQQNSAVIRVQSADCICNFLALSGATKCLMEMNNEIAMRSLRNDANRRANCDAGNIEKQVDTAARQIAVINEKIKNGEIKNLSKKLQATALVRVNNPNATYEELAGMLCITKSGVVNRLRKCCQMLQK
jgi:DNA-binding protein WhiA